MDTTELSTPSKRWAITVAAGLVTGLTGVGFMIGWAAPHLVGDVGPHPVLSGSVADAIAILFNNLRVLATPFLLALIGVARSRLGRAIGDLSLLVIVAISTLTVGVELGRWQGQLIPYIPQLPVEWAALAVSLSAWVLTRNSQAGHRRLLGLATAAFVLVTVAAAIETWCTPQLSQSQTAIRRSVHRPMDLPTRWRSAVVSVTEFAPPTAVRCKVTCSLPLTRFGSARPYWAALTALTTTTDPHRRDQLR